MIDEVDEKILSILLEDASIPKSEIARRVGLAASAITERIKRLEAAGIIEGYEVRLDAAQLGRPLLAYIYVTDAKPKQDFNIVAAMSKVTGLEELHKLAGDDCYMLKVRTEGTAQLNEILDNEINHIPTVVRVRTTIVLKTVLETARLAKKAR
ncbi:MAG: Lrp/AsnC family transcriptional regulator [Pseudomonadota bacterium]